MLQTIYTRPIFTLARVIVGFIFNRFLPPVLMPIIGVGFTLVNSILTRFGAVTLLQTTYALFHLFVRSLPLTQANMLRFMRTLLPEAVVVTIELLSSFWINILKHRVVMTFISGFLIAFGWIAIISPTIVLRLFLGTIFGAMGIVWNASLASIEPLHKLALKTYGFLDKWGIKLPYPDEVKHDSYKILSYLGIVLLGLFGIAMTIVILENQPDIITPQTPTYYDWFLSRGIINSFYNTYININNYLYQISGTPEYLMSKMLMNSLYGKFGMDLHIYSYQLDRKSKYSNIKNNVYTEFIELQGDFVLVGAENKDENKWLDINIAIASAVTANARIFMSQFLNSPRRTGDVYYMDTDSIFCSKPLHPKWVHKELGGMKLEHTLKDFVANSSKSYSGINIDGTSFTKMKGAKGIGNFDMINKLLETGIPIKTFSIKVSFIQEKSTNK